MLFLLAPWLLAAIPAMIQAAGGIAQSSMSSRDIKKQNAYNSPSQQVSRMNEAGLPMAALSGTANAGSQSQLPSREGIKDAGHSLGNYFSTQVQLKQLKILDEEIKLKAAESSLKSAEAAFLLSGRGIDTGNTNLTTGMKQKLEIEGNTVAAGRIGNKIQEGVLRNQAKRQELENNNLAMDIVKKAADIGLTNIHAEGAITDNQMKKVILEYQPGMSAAQLDKLLKENGILATEQGLKNVQLEIQNATKSSQIQSTHMDAELKELSWERVGEEFKNYKEYQQFVQIVQDEMNKTPWERIKDPLGTFKAIAATAYTTVTGLQGQSSGLLNLIK